MEYLDGELGCSGDPAVGGEQGCVEVSGEDDVDGVVDDQVVSVGPRFGDERLAPADRDREREEPVERRGGSRLIDDTFMRRMAPAASTWKWSGTHQVRSRGASARRRLPMVVRTTISAEADASSTTAFTSLW